MLTPGDSHFNLHGIPQGPVQININGDPQMPIIVGADGSFTLPSAPPVGSRAGVAVPYEPGTWQRYQCETCLDWFNHISMTDVGRVCFTCRTMGSNNPITQAAITERALTKTIRKEQQRIMEEEKLKAMYRLGRVPVSFSAKQHKERHGIVNARAFESSQGKGSHEVTLYEDGAMSCTCTGWVIVRKKGGVRLEYRDCSHTRFWTAELDGKMPAARKTPKVRRTISTMDDDE